MTSSPGLAVLLCLLLSPSVLIALDPGSSVQVKTILKTTQSWDGQTLSYPQGQAEITGMIIEIAPGGETGWHYHPVPSFGVILEGQLVVRLKNGRSKTLKGGDAIAEVVNTLHNGKNPGKTPTKILVFYAGAKGGRLTVKP